MRLKLFVGTLLAAFAMSMSLTAPLVHAEAFNHNNIIDDAIFDKVGSMTAAQIDNFLNGFQYSCISPASGFRAVDPTGYNPTNGFSYGGYVTAGQVIYDAAQTYGINPQVLISTLQKEQSLVVGGSGFCENGSLNKYAAAVGYGCPDGGSSYSYSGISLYQRNGNVVSAVSGTCVNSAAKAGFSQQVIRAAWLFKFSEQRSEGNINWAVIKGSWNNSDDPQSCYSGPMTQGTWQRCPSGATSYYDGYTTIDGTAVHIDNGATAALYWYTPHFSGNQHFFDIFSGWFGTPHIPSAFKTATSGVVYVATSGYKFTVPSMALLQDFGIQPAAIQTVDQATADSVPTPDTASTGLSTSLSYLVKSPSDTDADGPTLYLISVGRRYEVTSMQQLSDFGLSTSNIAYLPLTHIYSLSDGGALSNFLTTPTHNAFQVSGGSKQIIFDAATLQSRDPSNASSYVSGFTASLTPSGAPITSREILVGFTSDAVYLFTNNTYYSLPSMSSYDCWGFSQVMGTPLYKLVDNSYVGPVTSSASLGCSVTTSQTDNFVLNGTNKVPTPSGYSITGQTLDQNLTTLANKLPTRSNALGRAIKAVDGPAAWYVENGAKEPIPSLTDLSLLGFSASQVDVLSSGAAQAIPASGLKLGPGQVVKADNSSTVSIISTANKRITLASGDDFTAYSYKWTSIDTIPSTLLDQTYPSTNTTISKYLYDARTTANYLMDAHGCYKMSSSDLVAYGQSSSSIQSSQTYQSNLFPYINIDICNASSIYTKSPSTATVYWIDAGQKHPVSNWSALVSKSGTTNPYIISLSDSTLATLPNGTPL